MSEKVKPGYKQTEVGVIPEDWEVKNLGALVTYTNGKAHEQNITESGRFVVVNSKFISSEGVTRKYSDHCFCPASKGNVLMVMSDVPNGRAIAKCFFVESDETYTINQRICVLSPRSVDGKLLFYKLDRNPFYLAFDDGSKQTNLRKDEVLSCPLGIPKSDDEQRAIAGVLSDVDALIGALNQLIAKKRDLKQAAMQQLLPGRKRLPGFHGEWVVKRLGEIGEFKNGINKSSEAFGHGSPFVNLMDVFGVSAISIGKLLGLINSTDFEQKIYDLRKGDVIFIRSSVKPSGVGLTAVIENDLPRTVYSGFLIRFRDGGLLNLAFKKHCFYEEGFRKRVISSSSVSANTNINQDNLKRLSIPLPPTKAEQTAIAEVLSDMDAEVAALEQRRGKTHALKQGMMQELLTGRTRLV